MIFLLAVPVFDIKHFEIFGSSLDLKEAVQSAKQSVEDAEALKNATSEAAAIVMINQYKFLQDEEMKRSFDLGFRLLRDIYGTEYQQRVHRLLSDGYISLPKEEKTLGNQFTAAPISSKPPLIEYKRGSVDRTR